jgi:uncharacterized protein (TIGR02677 family)
LAGRHLDAQPLLRYATVAEAPLHRAIIDVFTTAATGYTGRLSPADVHGLLIDTAEPDDDLPSLEEVAARLHQLLLWGNLSSDHDSSRAASLDAYGRTAYVYDLTPGGEAAAEALEALEEGLRRVGGLQAVALRQIDEMLGELAGALAAPDPDGERVYLLCEDLHARFKSLTTNAAAFMQKVNKLLSSPVLDTDEFTLFKVDTITYLTDFIGDLDVRATHIRRRLDDLDAVDAVRRDAALAAAQTASGQLSLDGSDVTSWTTLTRAHLAGLADWFRAAPEERTGATVLYSKARDAVLGITRVAERIREAASSPSSRSTDLLALAAGFEAADDDAAAHLLWHAAFGLAPSRHLGMLCPTDAVPASTSWWEPGSAVPLSRQLRVAGRTDYVRRAMHVPDRSEDKRMLAARAREQHENATRAAGTLTALGRVRLSQVTDVLGGELDHDALLLVAGLLSRAVRTQPHRDGTRTAASVDGTLHITVTEPDPPAAAQLRAISGTWTLPDYRIHVQRREEVRAADRAAADRAGTTPPAGATAATTAPEGARRTAGLREPRR